MSGIYLQIIEGREAVGGWKTELGRSENRGEKKKRLSMYQYVV